MVKYEENLTALLDNGVLQPVSGASVAVTDVATGLPATLFKDDGVTPITQLTTDSAGYFAFRAANGKYKLKFSSAHIIAFSREVVLYDRSDDAPLTQAQAASPSGASGVGYGPRTVANKLGESISFYDKGAVGDGVADDTAAVQAAIADHMTSGKPLLAGAGRFKVTAQIAIDVAAFLTNTGINIKGVGRRGTILVSTYSGGVPFLLTGGNAFFHTLGDIGFEGSYAGPILQIGKNDFSDAFNSCDFTGINVNNSSTNAASEGARLNYVLQSRVDIVSNCAGTGRAGTGTAPGAGAAIVLRQVQFSSLSLAGGNANIALKLTAGYNFGNTFGALDLEEANVGLQIENAQTSRNQFVGGQILGNYCINNTAGSSNVLQGVNLSFYGGGAFINGSNFVGTFLLNPGDSNAVNKWYSGNTLPGTNAATMRVEGPDANLQGEFYSKGSSGFAWFNNAGNRLLSLLGGASLVNYLEMRAAAAGAGVQVGANGSDSNIGITFAPKGSGLVSIPLANLPNYATDSAAATGGVPVGGLYRNGSALQVRAA